MLILTGRRNILPADLVTVRFGGNDNGTLHFKYHSGWVVPKS